MIEQDTTYLVSDERRLKSATACNPRPSSIGPENTDYYLIVEDFLPFRFEVESNTLSSPRQRRPTDQQSR